jgi:hypothetical protein
MIDHAPLGSRSGRSSLPAAGLGLALALFALALAVPAPARAAGGSSQSVERALTGIAVRPGAVTGGGISRRALRLGALRRHRIRTGAAGGGASTLVPPAGAAAVGSSTGAAAAPAAGRGATGIGTRAATSVGGAASQRTLSRAPALAGALGRANRTASTAHARKGHVSALAIVIGALGALLVLACAGWALARRRAFEPHWWLSARHSMAEAGWRASGTWAEFTDWVRLGH